MYKNKSDVANALSVEHFKKSTEHTALMLTKDKNVPIQPYPKLWFRVSTQFAFLLSRSAVEQPSAFTHWRFSHPICGVFILQTQQISAANPGIKLCSQLCLASSSESSSMVMRPKPLRIFIKLPAARLI